jgi:predicted unusual protein kinase regulating ubiquinone biosynthesis (AarF/ABC1/UbiB family)
MNNNINNFIYFFFLGLKIIREIIKYKLSLINYNLMIINICEDLRKNNILYVKIVQWNIQDYCNIDEELKQYFNKFGSNVPYTKKDIDFDLINKIQLHFNNILKFENNFSPINSGTTSLVFKGKLNEKQVAIKILRKNIFNEINFGIENLVFIMNIIIYFLSFFYNDLNNNFISLIYNNKNLLLSQCDLLNEVKNIDLFKKTIGCFPNGNIIIPHIYNEFTEFSNNIVVMDFLNGKTVSDFNNSDLIKYNLIVQDVILNSYLLYKVVHADLHTGNIILLDNCKVGIIDFGMIIKISSYQSNNIFKLFLSLANSDVNLLMKSIACILYSQNSDLSKIQIIIKDAIELIKADLLNKNKKLCINNIIKVIRIILIKINNNNKININSEASHILLSLISSLNTIDIFASRSGLGNTIGKYLSSDTFFD